MSHQTDQTENCHVDAVQKPFNREDLAQTQAAYLAVSGMGCPRCATRVNNSLLRLDGVVLSEVILEESLAAVAYDPDVVTLAELVQAVSDAGNDGRHRYAARVLAQMPARDALYTL